MRGAETGRSWAYHLTADRLDHSNRWRARATDDQSLALIHVCPKETLWQDEYRRLQRALVVARLPTVRMSRYLRQFLDYEDVPEVVGEWGYPGELRAVWEWATESLSDALKAGAVGGDQAAESVRLALHAALVTLHECGIVHLDVTPWNILLVAGQWKLADLDSCTRIGRPVRRHPPPRYQHPARRKDGGAFARAVPDFDWYGLERVLEDIRER